MRVADLAGKGRQGQRGVNNYLGGPIRMNRVFKPPDEYEAADGAQAILPVVVRLSVPRKITPCTRALVIGKRRSRPCHSR
jgi:hypothetical protein